MLAGDEGGAVLSAGVAASDSSLVSLALSVLKKDTNILESTSGAVMLTDIASRVGILIGTRVNRKCTLGG